MNELFELLGKLTAAHGPAGDEENIRSVIRTLAQPWADEIETDVMGNLLVYRRGGGPKVMFSAHMDSIGLVVTHITKEGFLRCGRLGGVEPKNTVYTPVRFRNGVSGGFCREEKAELEKLRIDECLIDIGARDQAEAERLVSIGDTAVYSAPAARNGNKVISPDMDNRISCAILLSVLERLRTVKNDICFVFSAQEEVGLRGAKTAAYRLQPDYGVVLDVTDTCDVPGAEAAGTARLGGGAGIKIMDRSVICHPQMVLLLERLAGEQGIRTQRDIIDAGGTDAGVIHTTGCGVITGGISVPCRYIHTPCEVVDLDDAEQCVQLSLALAQCELEPVSSLQKRSC